MKWYAMSIVEVRVMSRWLRIGFLLLLLNSGYLLSTNAPNLFYAANVLLHVALGLGLAVLALRLFRGTSATSLALGAAALTGLVLVIPSANGHPRPSWKRPMPCDGTTMVSVSCFRAT